MDHYNMHLFSGSGGPQVVRVNAVFRNLSYDKKNSTGQACVLTAQWNFNNSGRAKPGKSASNLEKFFRVVDFSTENVTHISLLIIIY